MKKLKKEIKEETKEVTKKPFVFYHETKEYIIQAEDSVEARKIFNTLTKQK